MKHLLLTTIAAVVLVGCGPSVDIHEAAGTGNIEVVKQHLAAGTDVNARHKSGGLTPLHLATRSRKEIAELLIAKGADVNAKDEVRAPPHEKGATPLDRAIWRKKTATADLLRKHGGKTGEELKAEAK